MPGFQSIATMSQGEIISDKQIIHWLKQVEIALCRNVIENLKCLRFIDNKVHRLWI